MKRDYFLTFLLCGGLLLSMLTGCKSSKKVGTVESASVKAHNEFFQSVEDQSFQFRTLTARLNVDLDIPGKQMSSRVDMKMVKDSAFQLSVQPFLGIEIFRIELSRDTIKVVDRMNKRYMIENYSNLQGQTPIEFNFYNLQALFTNHLFIPGEQGVSRKHYNRFKLNQEGPVAEITDPLQADFDYGKKYEAAPRFNYTKVGGYEGGDSLVLSGKLSRDTTVRLYKTDLSVAAGSKVELTYNKLNSDDSKLQLGLIFADDTKTIEPVDMADGGASNGWKTATVDLSQYAGKKIATLGLIVKAGANPIDNYQVNIGKITVTDGAAYTPAAPTNFQVERAYADSDELTVKWDLADYSTAKNYLLYLDNTFLGGRYDDTLYVKHLPAKTGTLKLYAVGADGSRSLAAAAPLTDAAAVSGVKVEPGKDGNVKGSWTNPQVSGEKTVTVKSDNGSWRYAAQPYSQTVKVSADKSEATIPNAPVDGSRYVVTVDNAGGTTATATGVFADATIEPYPACSVTWNGDRVTLVRPETQDWRYLYMTEKWTDENGEKQEKQLGANYTYSQSTPPITGIIRGRPTPRSYTKSIPSGHELWVQVEDYNGNKTEPVKIQTADELAKCTVFDPTQPDAKESTLPAVDGSAVADGKATRTIQATVKDSFGNPLTNAEVAFTLPEGVTAVDGNATVKTDAAGVASLNVVSTKVGKYTVKAALGDKSIGEGVAIEFTKVAATPNKPGQPDKPNKPGDNKPGQNNNKNNDKNGASDSSLSKTGSSIIAIVTAAVVLLGAGTVVLRARSKME